MILNNAVVLLHSTQTDLPALWKYYGLLPKIKLVTTMSHSALRVSTRVLKVVIEHRYNHYATFITSRMSMFLNIRKQLMNTVLYSCFSYNSFFSSYSHVQKLYATTAYWHWYWFDINLLSSCYHVWGFSIDLILLYMKSKCFYKSFR